MALNVWKSKLLQTIVCIGPKFIESKMPIYGFYNLVFFKHGWSLHPYHSPVVTVCGQVELDIQTSYEVANKGLQCKAGGSPMLARTSL